MCAHELSSHIVTWVSLVTSPLYSRSRRVCGAASRRTHQNQSARHGFMNQHQPSWRSACDILHTATRAESKPSLNIFKLHSREFITILTVFSSRCAAAGVPMRNREEEEAEEEEREVCQWAHRGAFPFWRVRLRSRHTPKTFYIQGGQHEEGGANEEREGGRGAVLIILWGEITELFLQGFILQHIILPDWPQIRGADKSSCLTLWALFTPKLHFTTALQDPEHRAAYRVQKSLCFFSDLSSIQSL